MPIYGSIRRDRNEIPMDFRCIVHVGLADTSSSGLTGLEERFNDRLNDGSYAIMTDNGPACCVVLEASDEESAMARAVEIVERAVLDINQDVYVGFGRVSAGSVQVLESSHEEACF